MPRGLTSFIGPVSAIGGGVLERMTVDEVMPSSFPDNNVDDSFVAIYDLATPINPATLSTSFSVSTQVFSGAFNAAGSNIRVYWGDGTSTFFASLASGGSSYTHYYAAAGLYTVRTSGVLTQVGGSSNPFTRVRSILWWPSTLTTMATCFRSATVLVDVPPYLPRGVTSLANSFVGNSSLNSGNISSWDVSNITSFLSLFFGATKFNQSLSSWKTGKVTNMASAFQSCPALNQSFDGWDTSACTTFSSMFNGCSALNQDFSMWNFTACASGGLNNFMTGVTLNTAYYDALLILWDTYKTTWFNGGVNMSPNMGSSKYSAGAAATARASLVTKGWTITDGGPA